MNDFPEAKAMADALNAAVHARPTLLAGDYVSWASGDATVGDGRVFERSVRLFLGDAAYFEADGEARVIQFLGYKLGLADFPAVLDDGVDMTHWGT